MVTYDCHQIRYRKLGMCKYGDIWLPPDNQIRYRKLGMCKYGDLWLPSDKVHEHVGVNHLIKIIIWLSSFYSLYCFSKINNRVWKCPELHSTFFCSSTNMASWHCFLVYTQYNQRNYSNTCTQCNIQLCIRPNITSINKNKTALLTFCSWSCKEATYEVSLKLAW